ncbi:unnamed protein product [Amoebophrya sp. A25]|nr:unnamed protein product [Amoebophrya sp. A25]|eukprot:GSA25T00024083001.1
MAISISATKPKALAVGPLEGSLPFVWPLAPLSYLCWWGRLNISILDIEHVTRRTPNELATILNKNKIFSYDLTLRRHTRTSQNNTST